MKRRKFAAIPGTVLRMTVSGKMLLAAVMMAVLVLGFAGNVRAADDQSYVLEKGEKGNYYLYDASGNKVTKGGWYVVNGQRFFIYNTSGRRAEGWIKYRGKDYYLSTKTGVLLTGMRKINGKYYYLDPTSKPPGKAATGFRTIKNKRYYFRSDHSMKTGWVAVRNKKYYFKKSGAQLLGMRKLNGVTYYLDPSDKGALAQSKWVNYKGKLYYFVSNGKLNNWTGWRDIGSGRYYFASDHSAYTGTHVINGVTCVFGSDGRLETGGSTSFSLSADCAGLFDVSTGKPIFLKNGNTPHANASTTKILTCLLALENCKMTDVVTASAYAASQEPTKIYLSAGEQFYMKDLLYGLMLPSGNDAAVAIGEHISGSTPAFITLMNRRARQLGCKTTHFATPNGLDAGYSHYTTVQDLAKITIKALEFPEFREIVSTRTYSFSTSVRTYNLTTTDALLGNTPGIKGVKTGSTNKAGYCFVGLIQGVSGKEYVSVVLGCPTSDSRWNDTRALAAYAIAH